MSSLLHANFLRPYIGINWALTCCGVNCLATVQRGRHVIELVAKTARKNPRQYLQHEKPPFRGTSTVVLGMCVAVAGRLLTAGARTKCGRLQALFARLGGKRLFIRATTAAEMHLAVPFAMLFDAILYYYTRLYYNNKSIILY